MSLLNRDAILMCVGQFVLVPAVAERIVNWLLLRTHKRLKAEDVNTLSQRFTRAFIASNLVQGSIRTIIKEWGTMTFLSDYRSFDAQYYTLGTLIYYVFDTLLLAVQRSKSYDLWMHHLAAILFSSIFLFKSMSESGWMLLLLAESLVPWGFLLFYFKLNELRANPLFKVVCYGGLTTIGVRCAIWATTLFLTAFRDKGLPGWLYWMLVAFNSSVFGLEYYWFKLYLTNLKQSWKIVADLKKSGTPPPSLWSVFRK